MSGSAANIPYATLNNGLKVPVVGMGCWMSPEGDPHSAEDLCKNALTVGYRHLDTAGVYGNEVVVGKAVRESGIPRSEIFITTKLGNPNHHRVKEAFEDSLVKLGIEYIDLYLMHWPQAELNGHVVPPGESPTFIETWKQMEKLLQTGKVKSIGVSNFSIKTLSELLPHCSIIPAANQVELNPCLPQFELLEYCKEKGILVTAYSPLGQYNRLFFDDPEFRKIAEDHKATPAQVAISWGVQRGTIPLPKSANLERMTSNITLITLTNEEINTINNIHKKPGMHRSLMDRHMPDGTVFGWTYEQLGWPGMTVGGFVQG